MLLSKLLYDSGIEIDEFEDVEINGLTYDSRKVEKNFLFFAIPGFKDDGSKYIKDAIKKGAVAIIADEKQETQIYDDKFILIKVVDVREAMAKISCTFFGNPSKSLKLIGVTGTNGKTTITYILKSILERAEKKTGLIGTINYQLGDKVNASNLTTPESIELNSLMREMKDNGYDACVMEASSIAIELHRVTGLDFDVAIFSNLTPEHLDFHLNMNNYFQAKNKLFLDLKQDALAISNNDDEYGAAIISESIAKKIFYSLNTDSDYKVTSYSLSLEGSEFTVTHSGTDYKFNSRLTGKFNLYNLIAGVSTAMELNIPFETIRSAIAELEPVDGRFNLIKLPNGAYAVIDYSHTSDSLKNAIEAAIDLVNESDSNGRVITVFGCGGNKDKVKRPVMGNYATELSDFVIITSDNPRYEDPDSIIDEIVTGIKDKTNYERIADRELAIKRGIEISSPGDLVLICGKGHETYQEINGVRSHFDDKEIVDKYKMSAGNKLN